MTKGKHVYVEKFSAFLHKEKFFNGKLVVLGCGQGAETAAFNEYFHITPIGTDISLEIIKEANLKYPQIKFEVQNRERLTYPDSSIQAFFSTNYVIDDSAQKMLAEIYRALIPEGFALVHLYLNKKDPSGKYVPIMSILKAKQLVADFEILHAKALLRPSNNGAQIEFQVVELCLQKPLVAEQKETKH